MNQLRMMRAGVEKGITLESTRRSGGSMDVTYGRPDVVGVAGGMYCSRHVVLPKQEGSHWIEMYDEILRGQQHVIIRARDMLR